MYYDDTMENLRDTGERKDPLRLRDDAFAASMGIEAIEAMAVHDNVFKPSRRNIELGRRGLFMPSRGRARRRAVIRSQQK